MKFFLGLILFVLIIGEPSIAQKHHYSTNEVTLDSDGWKLKGDLMLVKSKSKSPIVLMLNKANGDRRAYTSLSDLLARKNISSLRLDLRGHGASINKGKFIPFDSLNNANIKLTESYKDIINALKYLIALKQVDAARIAIVGASYSGEDMMIASRAFKYAKAYVALSPGSFSDLSVASIDSCNLKMLFIKSIDEKSMQGFEKDVLARSKNAKVIIVSGAVHATDILTAHPDISLIIADWLKSQL